MPESTIGRLIEAARCAPSAGNIQPWQFTAVLNDAKRHALADAAHGQTFIAEAPACIVVSAEPHLSTATYGDRGEELYCIQDTAAAVQNILLAATAFGLGTCWVGAFDEEAVRRNIGLSPQFRPLAIVPLGYPAEEGQPDALRAQEEVTRVLR